MASSSRTQPAWNVELMPVRQRGTLGGGGAAAVAAAAAAAAAVAVRPCFCRCTASFRRGSRARNTSSTPAAPPRRRPLRNPVGDSNGGGGANLDWDSSSDGSEEAVVLGEEDKVEASLRCPAARTARWRCHCCHCCYRRCCCCRRWVFPNPSRAAARRRWRVGPPRRRPALGQATRRCLAARGSWRGRAGVAAGAAARAARLPAPPRRPRSCIGQGHLDLDVFVLVSSRLIFLLSSAIWFEIRKKRQ